MDLLYLVGGVIYCESLTARGGVAQLNYENVLCFVVYLLMSFSWRLRDDQRRWQKILRDAKSAKAPVKVTESLKQGLVAYYPFNGNAKDESGNGNHDTVHNATERILTGSLHHQRAFRGVPGAPFQSAGSYLHIICPSFQPTGVIVT